jgi:hypothetical protein
MPIGSNGAYGHTASRSDGFELAKQRLPFKRLYGEQENKTSDAATKEPYGAPRQRNYP